MPLAPFCRYKRTKLQKNKTTLYNERTAIGGSRRDFGSHGSYISRALRVTRSLLFASQSRGELDNVDDDPVVHESHVFKSTLESFLS